MKQRRAVNFADKRYSRIAGVFKSHPSDVGLSRIQSIHLNHLSSNVSLHTALRHSLRWDLLLREVVVVLDSVRHFHLNGGPLTHVPRVLALSSDRLVNGFIDALDGLPTNFIWRSFHRALNGQVRGF